FLRISLYESGMFSQLKEEDVPKGSFFMLFSNRERTLKYLNCILIGLPIWYVIGLLVTFSPEIGKELGMTEAPIAGESIKYTYIGLALGDLSSGFLSQYFKSRKKILLAFLILTIVSIGFYFTLASSSLFAFYTICSLLGFSIGYWAIFITVASENFGTNIRATVTTSVPNFVRGSVVPLVLIFESTRSSLGIQNSLITIGFFTIIIAFIALHNLEETFGKDLNFLEK
ncbi:MAG: MFS transporter, partial [Candidatus Sericytochromatia bacterium]